MVKTYEEETLEVNQDRLYALFGLITKYIKEGYRQFRWTEEDKPNIASVSTTLYSGKFLGIDCKIYNRYTKNLFGSIPVDPSKLLLYVVIACDGRRIYQTFPLTKELPPKEIARIARVVFKWIKGELEKLA